MGSSKNDGSWFNAKFKTHDPELGNVAGLVARIFFRTNDRHLDHNDLRAIGELAAHVRQEIRRGNPVELSMVARADFRGRARYNQWLSEQRLKIVAGQLGRRLRDVPEFDSVQAVALGESESWKMRDSYYMSSDRVVEIWWNLPPEGTAAKKLRLYRLGRGFVEVELGPRRPIDLSPPTKARPTFRNSPYIDLSPPAKRRSTIRNSPYIDL